MLPKKLRFARRSFPDTRGLKRASSKHLSVSYGDSTGKGGVGVVISKKVAPLAVTRHLLKRRILSTLRPYANENRTIVVHTRVGVADLSFSELKNELISLLGSILRKN